MAVLKAKPAKFIEYLFPLLKRELVVPLITTRVADDTFVGAEGDTVSMKVGKLRTTARKYEWRTRNSAIEFDDIQGGGSIPITFGTHSYSATSLTDEQLLMDEIDLVREVLQPQVEAVALDLEADVISAYAALATREEVDYDAGASDDTADPYKVGVKAQFALDRQKRCPRSGRVWLAGANVAEAMLLSDRFTKFDQIGSDVTTAIREATLGRIAGLNVVTHPELDPDFSVVTHQSSLVLGTAAPLAPRGAAYAARASQDGFAMRWLMDYDPTRVRDRSIVSMFSGITEVYDEIFLSGSKKGDLKQAEDYTGSGSDVPKSARAVKVNFTAA